MANGNPNFEVVEQPALERFFAPIARALEDFAARHGLRLSKYEKQNPSWSYLFRHPAGGVAHIQVLRADGATVHVVAHWHICDFEAFRRSTLSLGGSRIRSDDPGLSALLESTLAHLLALSTDRLVPDGVDWRQYWRSDVTKEVQADESTLPLPIP
jgi:hypothetical protein